MTVQVRKMVEADIEMASKMQAEAFGGTVEERVRRYREGPRYTWQDGWVVESDGEVGAAALAFPGTLWLNGSSYATSLIGGVAVRATDRRRGFASQMMRAILHADAEAGRPFSLLYPFQHGFYRRLGYASIGFTHFFRLPLAQFSDDPVLRRRVRILREQDHESIHDLYHQSLLSGAGGLERNSGQWSLRWTRPEEKWVVYDHAGLQGYLAYEKVEAYLHIQEFVALTAEAERGLWAFVAAQIEQYRAATYHAPIDKPLWAMLREPLMFEAANRGFAYLDAAIVTAHLMARLVDIRAAFEHRRFDPSLTGNITLALHDSVLDDNNQTFSITWSDGHARVSPADGQPAATCDIVTLTQLFCGVLRASDARWYGRLIADDATVRLLDRALAGSTPFIHPADWF
jgi:predicted acetyltransferase